MIDSPLSAKVVFAIGPVPITEPVVVTWALMAVLGLGGWLLTRRLSLLPDARQTVLELILGVIEQQIRSTMRAEPRPYIAFVGTLFLFILAANWSSLIPGVEVSWARPRLVFRRPLFCSTMGQGFPLSSLSHLSRA